MKRSITAFLLAALAVICLCSCENTSIKENTSAAAPVSADPYEEVSGILPEPAEVSETSEGAKASYTCTVITNDRTVYFSDETAPTAFDRSISERGDFLLERYNISVVVEERNYSEVSKGIKNALDSGLSYCDLLSLPQSDTVKLYLAGLLYDMNTLPSFDPQSEIFDSNHALQLATNSTFYMIPDESAMVYDDLNVVFFNRETVSSAGYDPEALVQSGEWTWDKFSEIAKSVSDVSAGKYGFACYYDGEEFTYPMWMSIGRHVVKDTYKNKVKMTMSADTMLDLTDRLLKHYDTKYIYPKVGDDAAKAFETGNSAFIFHKLRYLYGLRDGSDRGSEYGFLPMPKYKTADEGYNCLPGSEARVYSMPATMKNRSDTEKEFAYALLSTTCALGRRTVRDDYISKAITQYLFDNTEAVTLRTITESVIFDFSWAYAREIPDIAGITLRAVADKLSYGSGVRGSIKRYSDAFNSYVNKHFK